MLNRLKTPWGFPAGMPILREEALTINPLYRPRLKNVPLTPERVPPRRLQCFCQNEVGKMRPTYCLNPKSCGLITSHSASSRKPRRRRGLGIGAEILFCLKKDWSGKPAPSGKPPNNEYGLIPNSSEIRRHFFGFPYSLSMDGARRGSTGAP